MSCLIRATPQEEPFDDPAYLFEPKYDGLRGLLYVTREGCDFRSKRGNILKHFQELCYWVREELRVKEAILDGEVVALDPQGRQDFRGLLAGRGNLHYAAFDALWVNGKDLRGLPLGRRKRALGQSDEHGALTGVLDRGAGAGSVRGSRAARPGRDRGQATLSVVPRSTVELKDAAVQLQSFSSRTGVNPFA